MVKERIESEIKESKKNEYINHLLYLIPKLAIAKKEYEMMERQRENLERKLVAEHISNDPIVDKLNQLYKNHLPNHTEPFQPYDPKRKSVFDGSF